MLFLFFLGGGKSCDTVKGLMRKNLMNQKTRFLIKVSKKKLALKYHIIVNQMKI